MYRGQLDRKQRQRLDAEKKVGEFRKKEAEKRTQAIRAREAAARSSTQSTIRSKLSEAERREKEANAALSDAASWQAKATTYSREEVKLSETWLRPKQVSARRLNEINSGRRHLGRKSKRRLRRNSVASSTRPNASWQISGPNRRRQTTACDRCCRTFVRPNRSGFES